MPGDRLPGDRHRAGLDTVLRRRAGLAVVPRRRAGALAPALTALLTLAIAACSSEPDGDLAAPATPAAAVPASPSATAPVAPPPAIPTPTGEPLAAPASEADGILDLHLERHRAAVAQSLSDLERDGRFHALDEMVFLEGVAHRALVLLPSRDGPTWVVFPVSIPHGARVELAAWVAIEPAAAAHSDGVDLGLGVLARDRERERDAAARAAIAWQRVAPQPSWREVRVDLAPFAGRTVDVVLAARETGSRSGDWLLVGDPRIRSVAGDGPARVDLSAADPDHERAGGVRWSEADVFKTYSVFRDGEVDRVPPGWFKQKFSWLRSLRLFSGLGANWGPSYEADYEAQTGQNPVSDSRWERPFAGRYEFFRDGPEWRDRPIADRFDWAAFDEINARAASSGLDLHLNLAGAPECFTGGRGHYHGYHYNEMPVVDGPGWTEYVDRTFAHLATRPWFPRAHFSFFTEPNCVWRERDGTLRRFGFQGDGEAYARQYLWTWRGMRDHLAPGQVHLGPWVVERDPSTEIENLPAYLGAIREEFRKAGEPLPQWSAFAMNVYETPHAGLDSLASRKVDYARQVVGTELSGRELAVRFDEFGLHPILFAPFEKHTGQPLLRSRWAMTWHAEMLALLLDEDVATAGSWLHVYMRDGGRGLTPYVAEMMLATAIGGADLETTATGEIRPTAAKRPAPATVRVQRSAHAADRVGWVASRAAGVGIRVALWSHLPSPASDTALARAGAARRVEIALPGAPDREWDVSILTAGGQALPAAAAERRSLAVEGFPDLGPLEVGRLRARGVLALEVRPGDLFLVQARAR